VSLWDAYFQLFNLVTTVVMSAARSQVQGAWIAMDGRIMHCDTRVLTHISRAVVSLTVASYS